MRKCERGIVIETVLISLITSLIVSLVTFILGLKSGKNQADRAKLQELYQKIYAHFLSLDEAIKEGRPKEWIDFKKKESMYRTEYFPLIREMKHSGELLLVKKSVAEKAENLEMECMKYTWQCSELANKLQSEFSSAASLFVNSPIVEEKNGRVCKSPNPNDCKMYRYENYYLLFDSSKREETLKNWFASSADYALVFTTRGNPARAAVTFYPGGLSGEIDDVLNSLEKMVERLEGYESVMAERKAIEKQMSKLLRMVSLRAKNPTSFWETFVGAFMDIFRG